MGDFKAVTPGYIPIESPDLFVVCATVEARREFETPGF